jgi:hypothetical protein
MCSTGAVHLRALEFMDFGTDFRRIYTTEKKLYKNIN